MTRFRKKGFTLIELLVVIAIIGILSSIVVASLSAAKIKANDAKRISDLVAIQTALELYYNANNYTYPNPGWGWRSQCAAWGGYTADNVIPGLTPTYLPKFPTDPAMDAPNSLCCYLYLSNGTDYKVLAHNCPGGSIACYNGASGGLGSAKDFLDPARSPPVGSYTWSCAVYTPGLSGY